MFEWLSTDSISSFRHYFGCINFANKSEWHIDAVSHLTFTYFFVQRLRPKLRLKWNFSFRQGWHSDDIASIADTLIRFISSIRQRTSFPTSTNTVRKIIFPHFFAQSYLLESINGCKDRGLCKILAIDGWPVMTDVSFTVWREVFFLYPIKDFVWIFHFFFFSIQRFFK